jgi:hypothetical protein
VDEFLANDSIVLTCRKQKNGAPFAQVDLTFDADSLVLRQSSANRTIVTNVEAGAANQARVLAILADHSGIAANAIAKLARLRRATVYQSLDALALAGRVTGVKSNRVTRWFPKAVAARTVPAMVPET